MNKTAKILLLLLLFLLLIIFLRFILGGSEDTWICQAGQWVKHGAPLSPKPLNPC